jgi:hypothetical protein
VFGPEAVAALAQIKTWNKNIPATKGKRLRPTQPAISIDLRKWPQGDIIVPLFGDASRKRSVSPPDHIYEPVDAESPRDLVYCGDVDRSFLDCIAEPPPPAPPCFMVGGLAPLTGDSRSQVITIC